MITCAYGQVPLVSSLMLIFVRPYEFRYVLNVSMRLADDMQELNSSFEPEHAISTAFAPQKKQMVNLDPWIQ